MSVEITRENACDHRSLLPIRIDKCDVCSGQFPKGTPFDVYACDLHGECSFAYRKRKVKTCSACLDRESVEFNVQRIIEEPRPSPRPAPVDPATCDHRSPIAHVSFNRQSDPWTATVVVQCAKCGAPFYVNNGPKASLSLAAPQSSVGASGSKSS